MAIMNISKFRVCGLPGTFLVQGWPFLVGRKCLVCTEPAKTRIENVFFLKICSPSKNANEAELYERFSQNLLDGRRKFCKKRNKHLRKRYKQPSYRNFYMRLFIGLNWFWETDITAPLPRSNTIFPRWFSILSLATNDNLDHQNTFLAL